MGSPRKVLREIDPKKLEAEYTLDKGTTYCDGLPTATVISKKVMLFEIAYDSISLTMKFNIEGEFLEPLPGQLSHQHILLPEPKMRQGR